MTTFLDWVGQQLALITDADIVLSAKALTKFKTGEGETPLGVLSDGQKRLHALENKLRLEREAAARRFCEMHEEDAGKHERTVCEKLKAELRMLEGRADAIRALLREDARMTFTNVPGGRALGLRNGFRVVSCQLPPHDEIPAVTVIEFSVNAP